MLIAIETYQGVDNTEVKSALGKYLKPHSYFSTEAAFKMESEIEEMVFPDVTDDRIFGFMTRLELKDFLDEEKTRELRSNI